MMPKIGSASNPDTMNTQCLNEKCIDKNKGYFYWNSDDINDIKNYIQNYSTTRPASIRRTRPASIRRTRSASIRERPSNRKKSRRSPRSSPKSIMDPFLKGGIPPLPRLTRKIIAFLPDPEKTNINKGLGLTEDLQIINNYSPSSIIPTTTPDDFFKADLSISNTLIFCGHGDIIDIIDSKLKLSLGFTNPILKNTISNPVEHYSTVRYSEFLDKIYRNDSNVNLVIVLACYSSNLFNFRHDNYSNKKFITCDTLVDSRHATKFLKLFLDYIKYNDIRESFIKSCDDLKEELKEKKKSQIRQK